MRARSLIALASLSVVALAGCSDGGDSPSSDSLAAGQCEYPEGAAPAVPVEAPAADPSVSGDVPAVIATSAGDIAITLTADRTPCTVGSFVSLAEQGYFDDTECHRLTTQGIFVLQCGDPTATGTGGPGYSYPDELDGTETYPAGTLAMANSGPDTNGSQFFLVYEDSQLPPAYTVFGEMDAEGLAVVEEIAAKGATGGAPDGAPADTVTIETVTQG